MRDYIEESTIKFANGTDISFAIVFNTKIVGRIGLHYIDQEKKTGFIGYWLAKTVEGQGIMTLCAHRIVSYGFEELGLKRIELKASVENQRSRAIGQKLGFNQDQMLEKGEIVDGKWHDLIVYSKNREDHQK